MRSLSTDSSLAKKIKEEVIHGFSLTCYFASWFCALSFLRVTVVHETSFSPAVFGLAFIKAGLCTKFLLIGEAVFPLNMRGGRGILVPLLRHSLIYLAVVLFLTGIETAVVGLIHGRGIEASLSGIGDGDPLRALAIAIVYWLILCPYLVVRGIEDAIGAKEIRAIFFGRVQSEQ